MDRLDQLIADYLDGSLSESEQRDLAELLRETPSHRARFLGQAEIAGLLANQLQPANSDDIVQRTMLSLPVQPGVAAENTTTQQIMAAIPTAPQVSSPPAPPGRSRWRICWAVAAAVVVIGAALAIKFIAFNPRQLASIAMLRSSGTVRIYSKLTGDARLTREAEEPLQSMDGVEVGADGHATITYWDGTVLDLSGDGARLWMSKRQSYMAEREISRTANLGKHLVCESGVLKVSAAKQPANAPMIIITPQGDAEIVGTQFVLTVKPELTKLDVTEGAVKLTRVSDAKEITVHANETASAGAGELKTVPLSP